VRRIESLRGHEARWGLLFVAPAAIYFSFFWVYPLLSALYTSFTDWDLFSRPNFVGLMNYARLVRNPNFQQSVRATLYYALGTAIPIPVIALTLALLVNRKFRGRDLFRTAFFIPAVTSWIAASIVWKLIYLPNAGLYLLFVQPFGIHEIKWLTSREWAMPAIIILAIWKSVGPNMVLFLAGLQNLPEEVLEAARVDGANNRQALFHITLPLLKPTTLFVMVMIIIGAFQVFTPVYVMTRGGPANITRVLPMFLYQEGFVFYRMGSASAVSVMMFLAVLGLTVIQLKFFGERE
jgi:ABC-type sugar transport system permease subunit